MRGEGIRCLGGVGNEELMRCDENLVIGESEIKRNRKGLSWVAGSELC